MGGLVKTILIFLIVYYSIRFFLRLLAPLLIKHFVTKASRYRSSQERRKQEGEVSIEKNKRKQKSSTSKVGEYVEFEEIDDANKTP